MIYPRKIEKELKKHLNSPEIIVLTGMRRVGKTTLYRSIYDSIKSDNKLFLDLENPITQKIFEEINYDNIVANLKSLGLRSVKSAYVFIDEIQTMPEVVKAIKYLYDHYSFKFFLTGSSGFYLKNLFPDSLAGRKFVFEIFPLDFEEFLVFKNQPFEFYSAWSEKNKYKNTTRYELIKGYYEEYLRYGGFPGVVTAPNNQQKEMRLADIFKSYFAKDVQNLAKFRELSVVRDLLLLLMSRVGSRLDITRLAAELNTSRETIYSYLSFLENTFFIYLLKPFTNSVDKQVVKAKKVYFCDTGIINQFARLSDGAILENAVFNNLRHYGQLSYSQKPTGKEIDFVLNGKVGLEVKTKGTPQDLSSLTRRSFSLGLKESYIVSQEFVAGSGFVPAMEV